MNESNNNNGEGTLRSGICHGCLQYQGESDFACEEEASNIFDSHSTSSLDLMDQKRITQLKNQASKDHEKLLKTTYQDKRS